MKKKKSNATWVIHLRHIFPAVSDLLLAVLALIPSFRFIISAKPQPKQSVFALIKNSWQGSREYLFSASAKTTPEGEAMYRAIFTVLILLILLFLLGAAINVFSMVVSYRDMTSREKNKNLKNADLSFIPNRIVLSIFRVLVIPIFFLPDIVARYYRTRLFQAVDVKYTLIHPAIIAAILFVITVLITVISKKYEAAYKRDVFFKKSKDITPDTERTEDEPLERVYRISSDGDTADRLRRMFEDKDK